MTHFISTILVALLAMLSGQILAAPPPDDNAIAIELPADVFALDAAGLDNLIRSKAGDLRIIKRTRIFEDGQEIPVVAPLPLNFQVAENDVTTGTLMIYGNLDGREYVEEVRMIASGGAYFVIVDRYLESDENRAGRSLPAFLHAGDDAIASDEANYVTSKLTVVLPVVKSIGGRTISSTGLVDGKASIFTSCNGTKYGYKWNGWTAINDRRGVLIWEVNGENLGEAGKVLIDNKVVPLAAVQSPWTRTRVSIDPVHSEVRVAQPSKLTLTTKAGNSSSYIVSTIPALKGRLLDQCTYFTALRRQQMGKSLPGSGGAYDGFTKVDEKYEPKTGHVFKLDNLHQLIVKSVSADRNPPGGVKRWTITFEDQNYDCKQSIRSWHSSFAVKAGKVIEYPRINAAGTSTQLSWYWP